MEIFLKSEDAEESLVSGRVGREDLDALTDAVPGIYTGLKGYVSFMIIINAAAVLVYGRKKK